MKPRVIWLYGALTLMFFVLVAMKAAPAGLVDRLNQPQSQANNLALRFTRTPRPVSTSTSTATLRPSATSTTTPSATATAQPTSTATATTTATPIATATTQPGATPTATTVGSGLAPVDPALLGTCTAAIHDRYVVTGPNGTLYRTWHPPVVLIDPNNPSLGTCSFAHEHGDDPTTSLANSSLPAFGYIGDVAGFAEPHEGFKVFVANLGVVNDEGRDARTSTRMVVHMGTGGVGRFDAEFHSMTFDLVAPDGHYVHVQGMADSLASGSICQRDAGVTPTIGRTVVTLPSTGCDVQSLYEIWAMVFNVGTKLTVLASPALFDPITIMNPNDLPGHRIVYDTANYFAGGPFYGCDREGYFGPVYWYNLNGPTTYQTDAFGNLQANGPLLQQVSAHNDIGILMSPDQTQFKLKRSQCVPGLGLKN